jgi:hypothetical protein
MAYQSLPGVGAGLRPCPPKHRLFSAWSPPLLHERQRVRGVRVPGAEPGIKGVRGIISSKTYPCKPRCPLLPCQLVVHVGGLSVGAIFLIVAVLILLATAAPAQIVTP